MYIKVQNSTIMWRVSHVKLLGLLNVWRSGINMILNSMIRTSYLSFSSYDIHCLWKVSKTYPAEHLKPINADPKLGNTNQVCETTHGTDFDGYQIRNVHLASGSNLTVNFFIRLCFLSRRTVRMIRPINTANVALCRLRSVSWRLRLYQVISSKSHV
jgi:hypothetical protein